MSKVFMVRRCGAGRTTPSDPATDRTWEAGSDRLGRLLARDLGQALVEAPGVRLLGLGERLEPLGELGEALVPRRLRHARVHLGVLVRLTSHGRLEIQLGLADRFARRRIADLLQEVEVAERVAGLGVRGVLEEAR